MTKVNASVKIVYITEAQKAWLAGIIDGDGCFTISLSKQHNSKQPTLNIWAQVTVNTKLEDKWYLDYIRELTQVGSVYIRQKGSPQGYAMASWQTTNFKDALFIANLIFPYLVLKRKKAQKFTKILKFWINSYSPYFNRKVRARMAGQRLRKQKDVLKIVKVACELNIDRSTRRYKNKLSYKNWVPLIKEWYPE